jgi:methyl-accepting chemotaxis protein
VQAVIEFEMDGTIIHANENFLVTLGYGLAEIQGKHHRMFAEPSYAQSPEYAEFWAKLNRGEFESAEYKRIGKGGKEVWIQASYNPIMDLNGQPFKVVKYATDITDQVHLRISSAVAARLGSAMEGSATANVQIDRELIITGANPSTLTLVRENLPVFKAAFPQVDFENLVGTCIDVFHKNPAHQRGILGDAANLPHTAEIEVGDLKFALNISAMRDSEGSYIGANLEWNDVTSLRAQETSSARLMSAMEGSGTASVQIDRDLKITGANPATIKIINENLAVFQKAFPTGNFDELVGTCIDIFHKVPSYQRGILNDVNNFPHRAEIEVGDMKFALNVSGMLDAAGAYIGANLEWSDVTEIRSNQRQQEVANKAIGNLATAAQAGDLSHRASTEGLTGDFETLVTSINGVVANVSVALRQIAEQADALDGSSAELNNVSQTMAGTAEETSAQANVVSAAAEEVSKNVQTVATGTEEMSASIKEIAGNASEGAKVANQAVDVANATNLTISKLGESSAEIGQVIKVITSIAQQTNLLALNATIEAARAGEAGKGFAVVANEVKELAKETAKATEDISQKIETIQGDTQSAVSAIAEISEIINKINDIQSTIASAVEEQTATTNEIGRNVTEAAKGTSEIAENITTVATAAEETTTGATNTQKAASELSAMANELKKVVSQFTF